MSRSITVFIILLVVLFSFLFMRNFTPNTTPEAPANAKIFESSSSGETNFHNWREFTPATKNFKVLLPALPQHVADKVPDPATGEIRKYETYIAGGDNGAAFMINAIVLEKPVDLKAADVPLKAAVTDIISRNKENKLNDLKASKFRNYPAYDFSITSNEMTIAGKVFTQGDIIYILSMIAQTATFNPQELMFFVNSFELTAKSKQ